MYFEFMNKTKICAGKQALTQLDYECQQYGMTHPLVLTDETLNQLHYLNNIKKNLSLPFEVFTHIPVDSSVYVIEEIRDFYLQHQCVGIIAMGGGSVLDSAKGVYLLLSQDCDSFEDILGFECLNKGKDIPFFAIPTTSGTGSEATCVAVVSHPKKQVKLEIISQHVQSDVAFLDPIMTKKLPLSTTVSTAIDALTHAIEAYTCSQKNVISDAYASVSMKLIYQNILSVIQHPQDEQVRTELALASYLAGGAFSNSMVGLVHAIGHALGAVCHIPHGHAMSLLLISCMNFNLQRHPHLYDDLLLYFGEKKLYASTDEDQLSHKAIEVLVQLLQTLHQDAHLPISLQFVDGLKTHLDEIAEKALNDGALLVNCTYVTKKDIIDILEGQYEYSNNR